MKKYRKFHHESFYDIDLHTTVLFPPAFIHVTHFRGLFYHILTKWIIKNHQALPSQLLSAIVKTKQFPVILFADHKKCMIFKKSVYHIVD